MPYNGYKNIVDLLFKVSPLSGYILQVYGNYATIRESYTKMPVISPLKGSNTLYLEKGQLVVYSKWSIALPLGIRPF
jgi:hypothetical protein